MAVSPNDPLITIGILLLIGGLCDFGNLLWIVTNFLQKQKASLLEIPAGIFYLIALVVAFVSDLITTLMFFGLLFLIIFTRIIMQLLNDIAIKKADSNSQ